MNQSAGEVHCVRCGGIISSNAKECPACKQPLGGYDGTTIDALPGAERLPRPMPKERPDPDAVPRRHTRFRVALVLVAAVGVLIVWRLNRIDRLQKLTEWRDDLGRELTRTNASPYRLQPDNGRQHRGRVFYVGEATDLDFFATIPRPPQFSETRALRVDSMRSIGDVRLVQGAVYVLQISDEFGVQFSAVYQVDGILTIAYARRSFLLAPMAAGVIGTVVLLVPLLDRFVIFSHRRRQLRVYEEQQRAATALAYQAQEHLVRARELLAKSDLAKALVATGDALQLLPDFPEAVELRRQITMVAAERASVTVGDFAPPPISIDHVLYLRVIGTPYAYRAQAAANTINVGRQRPNPSAPEDQHNHLVIRVPASVDKTLRISRRHFEINRIAGDYFVIDRSGGNTRLNGRTLDAERPARIASGDRLLIADVLTLEVVIRPAGGQTAARIIQLGDAGARFELEATVGDMLTEV